MNEADNAVAGRMVDSFVNVENVRLFNNEKYEIDRVDLGLSDYERAANQSRLSLMYLNLSQTMIVLSGVFFSWSWQLSMCSWRTHGWWIRDPEYLYFTGLPAPQFLGLYLSSDQAVFN